MRCLPLAQCGRFYVLNAVLCQQCDSSVQSWLLTGLDWRAVPLWSSLPPISLTYLFPPSHLTYLPFSHITFSFLPSHLTSYPPSLPSSLPPIYLSHLPSLQSISPIFLPPISPCLLPSLLPPSHPVSIASIFLRTRAIMR